MSLFRNFVLCHADADVDFLKVFMLVHDFILTKLILFVRFTKVDQN